MNLHRSQRRLFYRAIECPEKILRAFPFLIILLVLGCAQPLSLRSNHTPEPGPVSSENESNLDNHTLTIVAIDVGQGDSTLLITPSWKTILIDAGSITDGIEDILPLFSQLGIDHLDYLFASHYDADHIGGVEEVIAGDDQEVGTEDDIKPKITLDRGDEPTDAGAVFDSYLNAIEFSRQTLHAGDQIDLGDEVIIKCLVINGTTVNGQSISLNPDDENSYSMGLLITYGDFRYFTAGDLTGGGLSGAETTADVEGLVAPLVGIVDLLHVNHHGSETSSSEFFLETLMPTVSIISTGDNNSYGHPSADILFRLNEIGTQIYQTETGSGGLLPEAHILDDSIFVYVEADGSYTVNGDPYETK